MHTFFNKYRCYLMVLGGFLINLSIGGYYSSGNIVPYINAYMQNNSISGHHVTSGNLVWISGLLSFGMGTAVSAGGFMENKIGAMWTTLIGGWIMSFNVCIAYFTIKTYLSVLALTYGLIAGIGSGLAYGVSFGTPIKVYIIWI